MRGGRSGAGRPAWRGSCHDPAAGRDPSGGDAVDDPYALQRFVAAQDAGGTYDRVLDELRRGRKTSHWMWFVFPQVAGLGQSQMSRTYAIASLAEAVAYLQHPVL